MQGASIGVARMEWAVFMWRVWSSARGRAVEVVACARVPAEVHVSMFSAAFAMLVCGWPPDFLPTENFPSSALTLMMCPLGGTGRAVGKQ